VALVCFWSREGAADWLFVRDGLGLGLGFSVYPSFKTFLPSPQIFFSMPLFILCRLIFIVKCC